MSTCCFQADRNGWTGRWGVKEQWGPWDDFAMSPVRSGFKETENMVQWKNDWIALAPKVLKGSGDKVPGSNMRVGPPLKVSIFSFRGLEYAGIVARYYVCIDVYCFAQCMTVHHE